MAPHAHHLHTNLDGLNLLGLDPTLPGLSSVTADELVAAQASLDLWTSTVFSTSSPGATPAALVSSESPLVGIGGPLPFQGHGPDPHQHVTTSSLDWSSLYPNGQHGSPTSSPPVLPPISTFAPPLPPTASRYTPSSSSGIAVPSSFPSFPGSAHHPSDSVGFGRSHASTSTAFGSPPPFAFASPAAAPSASSTTSHRSNTPARRSSRANAGAKGRAARAAAAAAEASEDSGRESPSSSSSAAAESGSAFISPAVIGSSYANGSALVRGKDLMSPDEIAEDKRRRNTEASARFRAKKKLRDAELQQSSAALRDRVASLEKEKDSLTSENRWLRDIVAEKAEVNPRLLNVLRQSMAEQR
ncbi:hypothetical protein Rhopal_007715-T1 [Rhodotorula paludigena]|uniref:BZIP domain-containing protein n=1 Tax=Rhodotorula paludigena TaxID=86838 RepID=A0AAV5GZ36_9BASI|nr:hypothetical protein Rhopal_007715-T1 [Rhodotorula paludigena]